jgi:type II secretory pathway pseudopilin PulG
MNKRIFVKIIATSVIVACVGALLLLLVNYVQKRERDITRLNDVAVIRLALESYFFNHQQYPVALTPLALGSAGARVLCNTDAGLQDTSEGCGTVFLAPLPPDPLAANGAHYFYASNGQDYGLTFTLERSDSGLAAGSHEANAEGIR